MITEDYVSFETAKLLKEKGFITPCNWLYCRDGTFWHRNSVWDKEMFPAPTQQMAMKWLREKGIECVVIPIWNTIGKQYRSYVLSDLGDKYKDNYDSYSDNISYEDAVEAALKYSLENLI